MGKERKGEEGGNRKIGKREKMRRGKERNRGEG